MLPPEISPEHADGSAETRLGRPSPSRRASIEPSIREAALNLFLEHGFEAVTMDMIAQRAQVSKRTLYKRYSGKLELFKVVVDEQVGRWLAAAPELYRRLPPDLPSRLRGHAQIIVESQAWTDLRRLGRSLATVGAAYPEVLHPLYDKGLKAAMHSLADDLRQAAQEEGHLPADWQFLAEMFFHAVFSWHATVSMLGQVAEDEATTFIDKVVKAILIAAGAAKGPMLIAS